MQVFHVSYKALIVAAILCGIYLPSIEKIYGSKCYIKALKYLFVLPVVSVFINLLSSLKYVLFDGKGIEDEMHGSILLVFSFFALFTSCSFYWNTVNFENIFQLWESLFQEELFSEKRQALVEKNRKFTLNWLKRFGGISMSCTIVYSVSVYFKPEKKLDHPIGIPYRNQSPDFELISTLELFLVYFGFFTMIVYDSMTMALLSLEEAQFRHLKISLGDIIESVSVTDSGAVQVKVTENSKVSENVNDVNRNSPLLREKFIEAEKYLQIWISQHKQILKFHEELEQIFFYPFAVKFLVFIMILCLICFLLVTDNLTPQDTSMSIVFCANVYATFYINISFADSTKEMAESMFAEAFSKSWHLFPKKLRTGFHIILMRSNRPVNYTALKIYPLTARSFLKIFTSAYTFFTFLLQIKWKKERELNESVSNFSLIRTKIHLLAVEHNCQSWSLKFFLSSFIKSVIVICVRHETAKS